MGYMLFERTQIHDPTTKKEHFATSRRTISDRTLSFYRLPTLPPFSQNGDYHKKGMSMSKPMFSDSLLADAASNDEKNQAKERRRSFKALASETDMSPENRGETSIASLENTQRDNTFPQYTSAYAVETWKNFQNTVDNCFAGMDYDEIIKQLETIPFVKEKFSDQIQCLREQHQTLNADISFDIQDTQYIDDMHDTAEANDVLAGDLTYVTAADMASMTVEMLWNQLKREREIRRDQMKGVKRKDAEIMIIDAEIKRMDAEMKRKDAETNLLMEVGRYVRDVNSAVAGIHTDLVILSNPSQAEEGASYSRKRDHDGCPKDTTKIPTHEKEFFKRHQAAIPVAEIGKIFYELKADCQKLERFTQDGRKIDSFKELSDREKQFLSKFSATLQSAFEKAALLGKSVPKEFKTGLLSLEQQLRGSEISQESVVYLPGPQSPEEDCVQPFLLSLLRSLGTAWEKADQDSAVSDGRNQASSKQKEKHPSPHKVIKNDCNLIGTSFRHQRVADKAVAADGCFVFLHLDDSIEVATEVKPGERVSASGSGKGPMSLLKEGENQILSHLAKHVFVDFNFVGIGVDTMATGMYLTATHLQFIRLELLGMGTPNAKLVLCESSILPLLSRKNFDSYIKAGYEMENGKKFSKEWAELKSKMYGDEGSEPVDSSSGIPSGLVALFHIMTTSRTDLFGPNHRNEKCGSIVFESSVIKNFLGSGSFASVYSTSDENVVIKLSGYGAKEWIQNEADILKKLGMMTKIPVGIEPKGLCIVRLISDGPIEISIGKVSRTLPGLRLTPRGIPFLTLAKSINDNNKRLKYIGERLLKTLEHVHKKDIYHRDISVHNIMIDCRTNEPFLVDWGHACYDKKEETGFVGTPCFAHREIFEQYPSGKWLPDPKYDKSALAFSMAALSSSDGLCPWVSFQPKSLNDHNRRQDFIDWADGRSEMAWKILQKATFEEKWKSFCNDADRA